MPPVIWVMTNLRTFERPVIHDAGRRAKPLRRITYGRRGRLRAHGLRIPVRCKVTRVTAIRPRRSVARTVGARRHGSTVRSLLGGVRKPKRRRRRRPACAPGATQANGLSDEPDLSIAALQSGGAA